MSDEQQSGKQEQKLQQPDPAQGEENKLDATDWKAEARKWEQRAKDNKDAATRLQELEEAQKSEAQKLADRAESAEKLVADFQRRDQIAQWASEAASEFGVPADAIRGESLEDMKAHAEQLKSLIGPQRKPDPKQGDAPPSTVSEERKFARQFFGGS